MTECLSVMPVLTGNYVFFFDPDGTPAGIKPYPGQIDIPAPVLQLLQNLRQQQRGGH
ncbi:hypothetical protein [Martelella alba]|uniref:hypothetical protein n=1 Tax=Martelella alba TaxID=2590451 RepID=UPI001E437064|nr:hypothetical protein [Martelella alba]